MHGLWDGIKNKQIDFPQNHKVNSILMKIPTRSLFVSSFLFFKGEESWPIAFEMEENSDTRSRIRIQSLKWKREMEVSLTYFNKQCWLFSQ